MDKVGIQGIYYVPIRNIEPHRVSTRVWIFFSFFKLKKISNRLRISHVSATQHLLLSANKKGAQWRSFLYSRRGRDSNSRYPFGYSSFQDWCIQSQVFSCWKISRPRLGTVVPLPLVYSMSSQTNTLPPLQIGCVNYTTGK